MSLQRTNRTPWRQRRPDTDLGPGDRSGQGSSKGSISAHRPQSTAEYSHPHERPNHHTGHSQPGHCSKIMLRALPSVRQADGMRSTGVRSAL
jgi:hypothetical protein